jgi:anti-anti-sigma regulatory factor
LFPFSGRRVDRMTGPAPDSCGNTVLKLKAALDPTAMEDLLRDLRKARNTAVILEAGEVSRVSTLALQALLSAWMTWKSDGHDFHIASPSSALLDAATLLGFPPDFLQGEGIPS